MVKKLGIVLWGMIKRVPSFLPIGGVGGQKGEGSIGRLETHTLSHAGRLKD